MSTIFRWPLSRHESSRRLTAGKASKRGTRREGNEDFVVAEQEAGVFIVADGMGGHPGGAEASEFVSSVLAGELMETPRTADFGLSEAKAAFYRGVANAIKGMREIARSCPCLSTMGSTLVAGWFVNDELYYAHAGDSRLYLLRDKTLKRLTCDHSLNEELRQAGLSKDRQRQLNRWRHCITRYVGPASRDSRIDIRRLTLRPNDRFILLTDGITDALTDDAIERAAQSAKTPTELCNWLITAARGAGTPDDTSCVVVDYSNCVCSKPTDQPTKWELDGPEAT